MLQAQMLCHRLAQHVIGGGVVTDQGADMLYDPVVFENRAEAFPLTHTAIAMDRPESNQDVPEAIPCVDKTGTDGKEKVMARGGPYVDGKVDACLR